MHKIIGSKKKHLLGKKEIMNYLRLIRYKNLLIIIATMFIVRYALIREFMPFQLSMIGFCLLVMATVCISAAGYIINDYFDVNADMMNKPDSVIIGKYINRRNAMILHWVLNIVGCACGAVVSFGIGRETYSLIFVFIAGILWFYSTTFSKEPILGNVIVAVLVAMVPLIEVLYELLPILVMPIPAIAQLGIHFDEIMLWSFGYSIFAFLLTLLREMVKDIEDVEGDRTYGRNTLPIAFGLKTARHMSIGVGIVILIAFVFAQICKLHDLYSLLFINIGITIPFLYSLVILFKAQNSQDYAKVSFCLKLIMMMGLLYLLGKLI